MKREAMQEAMYTSRPFILWWECVIRIIIKIIIIIMTIIILMMRFVIIVITCWLLVVGSFDALPASAFEHGQQDKQPSCRSLIMMIMMMMVMITMIMVVIMIMAMMTVK